MKIDCPAKVTAYFKCGMSNHFAIWRIFQRVATVENINGRATYFLGAEHSNEHGSHN